jgi:hypothetical protein
MSAPELDDQRPQPGDPPPPGSFTAPEKIASVAQAVLAAPSGDPKVAAVLAAIVSPLGRRFLLQPMLNLLPPVDEPAEWDLWLALLAGVACELSSDGVDVDLAEAREQARDVLAALFEEATG